MILLPCRRTDAILAAYLVGAACALPASAQQESLAVGLARSAAENLRGATPPPVQEAALGLLWILSDIKGERRHDIDRVFEKEDVLEILSTFRTDDPTLKDLADAVRTKVETHLRGGLKEAQRVEAVPDEGAEPEFRRVAPHPESGYAWLTFEEPAAGREYELQLLYCRKAEVVILDESATGHLQFVSASTVAIGGPMVVAEQPDSERRRYYAKISFPEECSQERSVALISRRAVPQLAASSTREGAETVVPLTLAAVYRGRLAQETGLFTRFEAGGQMLYRATTFNLGPDVDTRIVVYDASGEVVVDDDDGGAESLASRALWSTDGTQTYTIEIRGVSGSQGSFDFRVDAVVAETLQPGAMTKATPLRADGTWFVVADEGWLSVDAQAGAIYRLRSTEEINEVRAPKGATAIPYWGEPSARDTAGRCSDEGMGLDLGYVWSYYWVAFAPGEHLVRVPSGRLLESPVVLALDAYGSVPAGEVKAASLAADATQETDPLLAPNDRAAKIYEFTLEGQSALYGSFEAQADETVSARVLPIDFPGGIDVAFVGLPREAAEEAPVAGEAAADEQKMPEEPFDPSAPLDERQTEDEGAVEEEWEDEEENERSLGSASREIQRDGRYQLRIENPDAKSGRVFLEIQKGKPYNGWEVGEMAILGCHRPVRGDRNWAPAMDDYVGQSATILELAGEDSSGSWVVRVDVDDRTYVWRTRDLMRPD